MSIRLDAQETHEVLSSAHTGNVTTSRADGRPVGRALSWADTELVAR